MKDKIELAETKLNDAHKLLALLAHVPMDKYNPISQLLIETKDIIRLSQSPPVIDVEEVRERLDKLLLHKVPFHIFTIYIDIIFAFFLPYLQPKEDKSEWISVNDGLPEERIQVLAINGFKKIRQVSWMEYTGQNKEWFLETFTHWQPLPQPPTSELYTEFKNKK